MYIYIHQRGVITADTIGELLRTLNRKFRGEPLNGIILYRATSTHIKRIL